MFTGIIEDLGTISLIKKGAHLLCLTVKSDIFNDQKIGDSISVNGVCLTVSSLKNDVAGFDVVPETLKRSNLGTLNIGDRVNLERALKVGDRLSGHFVTGHIDCVGRLTEKDNNAAGLAVKIPKADAAFIVYRGSIAVDGISLTIAEIGSDAFKVFLIPHTLQNTNIKFKKIGDVVNIEFDIIGKYALRRRQEEGLTEEFLRAHGFS